MNNDPYLAVDEVAERLGLPLGVLVRRVQAGDVPARRIDGPDGPRYELRLGDLGIESPGYEPAIKDPAESVELTGSSTRTVEDDLQDAWQDLSDALEGTAALDDIVPPPRTEEASELTLIDYPRSGPLADIASMSLDPRELVAGLLDRWERTLEQRIYAEQRQRFETELTARQTLVKELQLELKTARAEHAAAQSEKERILAEREYRLSDAERALAQAQTELKQTQRKRGWFFRR